MEDTLINFETAVLAKEKGFDWEVWHIYKQNVLENCQFASYNNEYKDWIAAPTQSLLYKWLREKYYVYLNLSPNVFRGHVIDYNAEVAIPSMVWDSPIKIKNKPYEEAFEDALYELLKLI